MILNYDLKRQPLELNARFCVDLENNFIPSIINLSWYVKQGFDKNKHYEVCSLYKRLLIRKLNLKYKILIPYTVSCTLHVRLLGKYKDQQIYIDSYVVL